MRNRTAIHVEHKHAHHPLEFLFQRNISACRTFTKQSMKFLEKEVCDARGNVFSLFHSITLQLVQAPPSPNTNHTSYLQENRTALTEERPWPYMYTT